jgi:signal transduction histidine kinase
MMLMVHVNGMGRPTRLVMVLIGVALMAAGARYFWRGLAPVTELRRRLGELRAGREKRIEGAYPAEVQPLVDDLNALLAQREKVVQRAIAKAGDLAHGLKTPLALLAQEAEAAAAAGQGELAAAIASEVGKMRRQIDYHLAQARAAAAGAALGTRSPVQEVAEGLARTLRRLYAARELAIEVAAAPELAVKVQREDLEEMLGNLLDNACQWAKKRVLLRAAASSGEVTLEVEDDGPGLPPESCEQVLQRGVRADEAAPGSGLGLAIVRDLAELYGGRIELGRSPLGGLSARLTLPGG